MLCKRCGSTELMFRGQRGSKQRVQCKKCGRWDSLIPTPKVVVPAKVLFFDIETLPMKTYAWSLKTDYINPSMVIEDWCVLSWAAKWMFDPDVMGEVLTPKQAISRYDQPILEQMWSLLDEADIVIGHNSKGFDHKKLNTRFLMNGFMPPAPYKTIDTLQVARSNMAFSSNKLDYINQCLGIHQKQETDLALWKDCDKGDSKALQRMLEYNKNDVVILEELYIKFRPWIPNHPSMKPYVTKDTDICPCGNTELVWLDKPYRTNIKSYKSWRCPLCGSIGRSSRPEK